MTKTCPRQIGISKELLEHIKKNKLSEDETYDTVLRRLIEMRR